MRAPTRREQVLVLVFVVSLAWGMWNYRHLFTTHGGVAPGTPHPVGAITESAQSATDDLSTPAQPALALSAWGGDPFNRPWRGTRLVPASSGKVAR